MRTVKKAKLLRLHFGESDQYNGKPLYEAIVNRCRELKIAGATVFRGFEGYGTAADPQELGWLLSYSPYHHVSEGVAYPAVLFTIFGSDSRVDPLHARKMCAALQHATSAPLAQRPILLRRESDVGHGARAVSRSVSLSAETLSFAALHTGLLPGGAAPPQ